MQTKHGGVPVENSRAPQFTLLSGRGKKVRLADLKGKAVVLYFYPKDMTSGCTQEAIAFQESIGSFKKLGAEVIGISPDSIESHFKFAEKHGLSFGLLSDVKYKVCEKYGVWVEKSMYGRKYWGVQRSTFLIGRTGRIARVWEKVSVPGHVEEVLVALRAL